MQAVIVLRRCGRCGKDLTDAASIECGMGPECRGKANEILAKEIPQNMSPDQAFLALSLDASQFPEAAREAFEKTNKKLLATKAFLVGEGVGQDVRALVRELAYLLSWQISKGTRYALLETIKGLGYPAYAGYLDKKASASAATFEVKGERLYMKAVHNAVGVRKVNALWGVRSEASGEWSTPLAEAEDLLKVVRLYWPLSDFALVVAMVQEARKPKAIIKELNQWILVEAPYQREAVEQIKTLPTRDRWWDGLYWRVRKNHEAPLKALLSRFYRVAA